MFFMFQCGIFPQGGQIRNRHRYVGPKSLHLHKFTILSLLFLPPRGPNSIANFDGGAMAGFAPLDPPLHAPRDKIESRRLLLTTLLSARILVNSAPSGDLGLSIHPPVSDSRPPTVNTRLKLSNRSIIPHSASRGGNLGGLGGRSPQSLRWGTARAFVTPQYFEK